MKPVLERFCSFAGILLFAAPPAVAAEPTNAPVTNAATWNSILESGSHQPFGIEKRVPWTTSLLVGWPDPPLPYVVKRVFPKLNFKDPVDLANTPALERLFIAELAGKIFSFQTDPEVGKPDLVIDLRTNIAGFNQIYGITFHPRFATNRSLYICYVLKEGLPDGTRVSRFTMSRTDPPQIDPGSEKIILTWLSGGHNGGCLQFGPEGYLYISTGDGASPDPADPLNTGQDISDLLSSILRIDVDHEYDGKPYRVPPDNPFVNSAGARPEVWSYGFRNPWKMSFDRQSGALWVGDVGWELWEMIYRVERGGNYGWSIVEGPQPVKPNGKPGPTPILPPVVSHPHSEAASITGGRSYHGKRLRGLDGVYIYGDWVTGKLWGLRHDGKQVTWHRELANSTLQVICFGEDKAGELYIADYGGGIYQLEPNPVPDNSSSFPRKLGETGLFASLPDHAPAPGVIPFSVNAEVWSDGAIAERLAAFPAASGVAKGKDLWGTEKWIFPSNAVLAKTLSLEMESGKPQSRRRVETQILHFDGVTWNGYTYQWNEEQTEARLVDSPGADRTCEIADARAPGGHRRQTWHFHSRAECLRCHNSWAGPPLAFNLLQLNKEHRYPVALSSGKAGSEDHGSEAKGSDSEDRSDNQLRALTHIGILRESLFEGPVWKLANPRDTNADLQERARAWLHVNCAHCHRFGAGGSVASFFSYEQKLEESRTIDFAPSQGVFGIPGARVVAPGDPLRSVLYYRISSLGPARMPRIGSSRIDEPGVNLIHDWIQQLPKKTGAEPDEAAVAKLEESNRAALDQLRSSSGASSKNRVGIIDQLLASTVGALALLHEINIRSLSPDLQAEVIECGTSRANALTRDLFERFLPEEKRVKRLGSDIHPDQILPLRGDPARGEKVFFAEGAAQCFLCHRVRGRGRDFGPDLSRIGQKYTRAQLLDSILNPSKAIDPAFATYQAETKSGLNHSGLLVRKTADEVVLKDANLNEVRLQLGDLKTLQASKVSAMPDGLLQGLTAQEAADLLEFLGSLR